MFGCDCFYWSRRTEYYTLPEPEREPEPEPFALPAPLPEWPQGEGFSIGRISLGELEVTKITKFQCVWSCNRRDRKTKGVSFYRPVGIPDGFSCLGHYCQSNDRPFKGYVLAARDVARNVDLPALMKPLDYKLIWSAGSQQGGHGYFWLPNPPKGYKATGFLVTDSSLEPSIDEIRCVRSDLTEDCEACDLILNTDSTISRYPFWVWSTRPCQRGVLGRGVCVGTFFCCSRLTSGYELGVVCLRNMDNQLRAMPNLNQVHALIEHYGPTVFFHRDEIYLPSSVQWFFNNGALLFESGKVGGKRIDSRGSNLPGGGSNDGEFWLDLPSDEDKRNRLKYGSLESAELYVHIKPASGGTFTDIAMWVFCPFNGPATIKVGLANVAMNKVGEHVSDWEHFTLRVSNFNGELWSVYFSQHSGGEWVESSELEFGEGNRPVVYSSKSGHASFPHPGTYLQGPSKLGIGVRNDVGKSKFFVDSSVRYQIMAAEYLGDAIEEPCWLQYMGEWGPTIMYNARSELEKIVDRLPVFVRFSMENLIDLFPSEIYGEEGPTGPKEKDNWLGDERW
ncbi:hypothetical protein Nepgr_014932 [Nepenthes gracilis]|uniref:Vacuolar protein sorting-associated protein 62 n=1 Tax=Nepenthes gracilis TaxID=150966 RepID=A0AAD3SMP8_NEPGR|nr:hypothetical protein Nepgr_014932 [Nepenthes gracilis]